MSFGTYPSLKSAVVLVTGGASGIGEEIVRAFAAQGSRTGFVDLDAGRGRALADELGRQGAEVRFEPCDLRDIDQLKRAFAALAAALGPATVLVNNAARDDRHGWQEPSTASSFRVTRWWSATRRRGPSAGRSGTCRRPAARRPGPGSTSSASNAGGSPRSGRKSTR